MYLSPLCPVIAYNKIKSSNPARIHPPVLFGRNPAAWSPIVRSQPDNYLDYPGNVALLREPHGVFGLASRNSIRSSERLATGRNGNSDNFLTMFRNPAETLARGYRGSATSRSGRSQRVDAGRQARRLARDGVRVQHALGRGPVQFGLGNAEGGLRLVPVAGGDRRFDLLDEGAHPAQPRTVDRGALLGLPEPFFRGFVMRHAGSSRAGRAGLYRCRHRASTRTLAIYRPASNAAAIATRAAAAIHSGTTSSGNRRARWAAWVARLSACRITPSCAQSPISLSRLRNSLGTWSSASTKLSMRWRSCASGPRLSRIHSSTRGRDRLQMLTFGSSRRPTPSTSTIVFCSSSSCGCVSISNSSVT